MASGFFVKQMETHNISTLAVLSQAPFGPFLRQTFSSYSKEMHHTKTLPGAELFQSVVSGKAFWSSRPGHSIRGSGVK